MKRLLFFAAIFALVLLIGCASRPGVQKETIATASVPVAVGCVSGDRPADVAPLNSVYDAVRWTAFTVRQKAAAVAAQGLKHQNRATALQSATGACR